MRLSIIEGTRREGGSEPGPRIVYKWLVAKNQLRDKWLRLLSDVENNTDPIHQFFFRKKYLKNVPMMNNHENIQGRLKMSFLITTIFLQSKS